MKKFRVFLAAVLIGIGSQALADDYQYLTISGTGGDTQFSVSSIEKITFDNTDMILHLNDNTMQRIALSELTKMFFSDGSQGITVAQTQSKIHIYDGQLKAELAPGERLTLYNMKGEMVYHSNADVTIDLKTLTRGVYIVKVGNEAKKIMNR